MTERRKKWDPNAPASPRFTAGCAVFIYLAYLAVFGLVLWEGLK